MPAFMQTRDNPSPSHVATAPTNSVRYQCLRPYRGPLGETMRRTQGSRHSGSSRRALSSPHRSPARRASSFGPSQGIGHEPDVISWRERRGARPHGAKTLSRAPTKGTQRSLLLARSNTVGMDPAVKHLQRIKASPAHRQPTRRLAARITFPNPVCSGILGMDGEQGAH